MSETSTPPRARGPHSARVPLFTIGAGIVALVLVALRVWHWLLGLELLGWDSYPLIAANRIATVRDLAGTVTNELMDGRYPLGHYYRPLVHLSFALDHALWNIEPRGYHITDLAIVVAAGLSVGFVVLQLAHTNAGRWLGAWLGALLASAVFIADPVQLEVLSAPARRADSLAVLFTLLALALQLASRRKFGVAACVAAALCSKETGAIALLVVVVSSCLVRDTSIEKGAFRAVLRAVWPSLAVAVLFLAVRTLVLGGLGGGRESSLADAASRVPSQTLEYARSILLGGNELSHWIAFVIAIPALIALVIAWRRDVREPDAAQFGVRAISILFVSWFAGLVLLTSMSGADQAWYALPFVALRCVLLGVLVGRGLEELANASFVIGSLALVAGCALAGIPRQLRVDPERIVEFGDASQRERAFLDRFEHAIHAASPGTRVSIDGFAMETATGAAHANGKPRKIALLAPYSLEAFAELICPERSVRVELAGHPQPSASQGEVVVVLHP